MPQEPDESVRDDLEDVLGDRDPQVRSLTLALRRWVGETLPDAVEEFDTSAKLIGFTYRPGTYTHLIVAVAPQSSYVNLMFARGAELVDHDEAGLLEGTGKRARHVKVRDVELLADPALRHLVETAAARTPR